MLLFHPRNDHLSFLSRSCLFRLQDAACHPGAKPKSEPLTCFLECLVRSPITPQTDVYFPLHAGCGLPSRHIRRVEHAGPSASPVPYHHPQLPGRWVVAVGCNAVRSHKALRSFYTFQSGKTGRDSIPCPCILHMEEPEHRWLTGLRKQTSSHEFLQCLIFRLMLISHLQSTVMDHGPNKSEMRRTTQPSVNRLWMFCTTLTGIRRYV